MTELKDSRFTELLPSDLKNDSSPERTLSGVSGNGVIIIEAPSKRFSQEFS